MVLWIKTLRSHSRLLVTNWSGRLVLLIFLTALVLIPDLPVSRQYPATQASIFLTALLIGLVVAIVLHARFLVLLQKENQQALSTLDATGREFKSIFDNALDGILILNDRGQCLDANPAASLILAVSRLELIGASIAKFYTDADSFTVNWESFRSNRNMRGRAELLAGDGSILTVEFAASANHLPGRHLVIFADVTQRVRAERSLRRSEERFQQMANNIQEIFWMMNAQTREVLYVSKAYEAVTGRLLSDLYGNPTSYRELVHPDDRVRVFSQLEEAAASGRFDEEFRIVRPDGTQRWIWCKASAVAQTKSPPNTLVGIALDITSRKHAESEVSQHLAAAEAARAEAEVLRKATLTLTQNLRMDTLLDTLLRTLQQIVPYDSACVLLTETERTFLLARQIPTAAKRSSIIILDIDKFVSLKTVVGSRKPLMIPDTQKEMEWRGNPAFGDARSWLCIPLIASENLQGLLSVSRTVPGRFTEMHERVAKSLALAASIAIRNARLYECTEIYASELEVQLKRLKETQLALEQTQTGTTRRDN
jgi:PAS domain S-box-containing protein